MRKNFDVIIAGAGPAGCVLANRLSEDHTKQVLLVEAGPDTPPGAEHPDIIDPFALPASANPRFRWPDLVAEMDVVTDSSPVPGMPRPYLQGFGVGGASNINGMGADRGNPDDYEEWQEQGAEGWGWREVLPYFKKLERDLDFSDWKFRAVHGDSGPIPVRRVPRQQWAPFAAAIGDAANRRGMEFLEDYNADFREGVAAAPTNSLSERRVSASMAYLTQDVRARSNLAILPNTKVEKLSFNGTQATGVHVNTNGIKAYIHGREIILACGAIQSPLLLMRSGIGPKEHLKEINIEVVMDLPGTGANLQNHPYIILPAYLTKSGVQQGDNPWLLQNWLRYSSKHPGCHANDMHLMPLNRCDWHELGRRIGALVIAVFKSYSRGHVELSTTKPQSAARIRFNLLSDPRDFERLVAGLRYGLELLIDPTVESMRSQLFLPEPRVVSNLSRRSEWNGLKAWVIACILECAPFRRRLLAKSLVDPYALLSHAEILRNFVRLHAQPEYHVCGTCRMGRASDAGAVVGNSASVHGLQGLRVVDASIFPTIPRANTQITVMMVAEKISDAIKLDWGRPGRASAKPLRQ